MDQATYMNMYTVEEFGASTKDDKNNKGNSWGPRSAQPSHKDGIGFSIELRALPLDGRLVILPPRAEGDRSQAATRLRHQAELPPTVTPDGGASYRSLILRKLACQ